MSIEWTAEKKAALLERSAPGHTQTFIEIAVELFGTPDARNACIGMARRLRLPPKAARLPTKGVDAPIAPPVLQRVNGCGIDIYQLRRDDCRWPLGEAREHPPYSYCGHKTLDGMPYCEEHSRRAYSRWPLEVT
jgi:GcrA cell cycle regulator